MFRFPAALGLTVASVVLCGCYTHMDSPALQQQRLAGVDAPAPQQRVKGWSRARPKKSSVRTAVSDRPAGVTGRAAMPWPKRGTPEWYEIEAQDKEREARVQRAIRSICRGC